MKPQDSSHSPTPNWIHCSDRMPDGDALLLTASRVILIGDWYRGVWRSPGQNYWENGELKCKFHEDDITHWMPLPSTNLEEVPSPQETVKIHDDEFEGGSMCNDYDPVAHEEYHRSKAERKAQEETVKHTADQPKYMSEGTSILELLERDIYVRFADAYTERQADIIVKRFLELEVELEQLRAEKERLTEALKKIESTCEAGQKMAAENDVPLYGIQDCKSIARAALKGVDSKQQ